MNESSIPSLAIEEVARRHHATRFAHCPGVFGGRYEGIIPTAVDPFDAPIRVDAVSFALFTRGKGKIVVDQREIPYNEHTLVVVPPRSILSPGAYLVPPEGYVVMLNPQYLSECNLNVKKITQHMVGIIRCELATELTPDEAMQLSRSFEILLAQVAAGEQSIFSEDVVHSTVEMMTYYCLDLFSLHNSRKQREPMVSTRTEEYFCRFIAELSQHYLERRPVTYYADRLCVSSRYLTTVVRQVSGLSVSQWMHRYMLAEAKYLLKYTDLSVQEIAYKLSFPNQSFFGKFFKLRLGVSPTKYRTML